MGNIVTTLIVLGVMLFLTAVVLYFVFDVPSIKSELSGKSSKKRIEALMKANVGNLDDMSTSNIDEYNNMIEGMRKVELATGELVEEQLPDTTGGISSGALGIHGIVSRAETSGVLAKPVQDDPYNELSDIAMVGAVGTSADEADEFATGIMEEESTDPMSNEPFIGVRSLCVTEELTSL